MTTQTISKPVVSYFIVNDVSQRTYWSLANSVIGPHHYSTVSKSVGHIQDDPRIIPAEDYRTRLPDGTKIRVAVGKAHRPFGIIDLEPNEDGSSEFYEAVRKKIETPVDLNPFSRNEIPCGSALGLLYFLFGRQ